MNSRPLENKRILVTRAAHQAGKLSDGLRAVGGVPVEVPVLEIRPPASFDPLDAVLRNLASYDWLIVTSSNAVQAIVERMAACGLGYDQPMPKVAAVGRATAESARRAGFVVALTPKEYIAESLIESFTDLASGQRVLLARASIARDLIPDTLRATGAIVDVVDAYRNEIPQDAPEKLKSALAHGIDAATFTSSSSVIHLSQVARAAGVFFPFAGVKGISIGPVTSATLREHGWVPAAEADPHDIPGLIEAVISEF